MDFVVFEEYLKKCCWIRVNWVWIKIGNINFGIFLRFNLVVSILLFFIIWGFVIWCIVELEVVSLEMGRWKIWIMEKFIWMYIGI